MPLSGPVNCDASGGRAREAFTGFGGDLEGPGYQGAAEGGRRGPEHSGGAGNGSRACRAAQRSETPGG